MDKKQQIIAALRAFIGQRPGLEFGNYGDVTSYRAEMRAITKDLHHARWLLRDVELRDSITAAMIIDASRRSSRFRRLSIVERDDGAIEIDYCAGQYWPTEYRRAVCAVMASVLWNWKREYYMPARGYVLGDGVKFATEAEARAYADEMFKTQNCVLGIEEKYNGMTGGDWLRRSFRNEYGRAIASRWFN